MQKLYCTLKNTNHYIHCLSIMMFFFLSLLPAGVYPTLNTELNSVIKFGLRNGNTSPNRTIPHSYTHSGDSGEKGGGGGGERGGAGRRWVFIHKKQRSIRSPPINYSTVSWSSDILIECGLDGINSVAAYHVCVPIPFGPSAALEGNGVILKWTKSYWNVFNFLLCA